MSNHLAHSFRWHVAETTEAKDSSTYIVAHDKGRQSALPLLLKLFLSEQNIHNVQLIASLLPCLPVHSPHWSTDDNEMRAELIMHTLGCLKTHHDLGVLMSCIIALGQLAATHAPGDKQLSCDLLHGVCEFIQIMLNRLSSSGATQGDATGSQQTPPMLVHATRRVHNIYKGTPIKSSAAPPAAVSTDRNALEGKKIFRLLDASFQMILDWIVDVMSTEFLHSHGWVLHQIHETVMSYINTVPKLHPVSLSTFDYAVNRVLDFLLHKCGRFPARTDALVPVDVSICSDHTTGTGCWTSGLPSMVHHAECRCDDIDNSFVHYFIDSDTILSVMEPPRTCDGTNETSEALVVVLRSQYGRYVYEMSSLMSTIYSHTDSEDAYRAVASNPDDIIRPNPDGLSEVFKFCNEHSELLLPLQFAENLVSVCESPSQQTLLYCGSHQDEGLCLSNIEKGMTFSLDLLTPLHNPFSLRLLKQRDVEAKAAEENHSAYCTLPESRPTSTSTKLFIKARQMLTQFRFASFHNQTQVLELENTINLREKLSALDQTPCREQYVAWSVFAANRHDNDGEHVVAHAACGSNCAKSGKESADISPPSDLFSYHYIRFLLGMGWLVNLDMHRGVFL